MSYQDAVALQLQDKVARNCRKRNTGQKFSGVVLRKMEILAEQGRLVKKYCCGFVDRHRLLG